MILSRVKFYPQERVDLEDLATLLSAARTDAKLWTKQFLSGENYILKGFAVSGLGLKAATIEMDNATLVLGNGTEDFSYFISEDSPSDIVIPDADLVDGVRNYVELELNYEDGTPITKAFWDPSANGGLGAEFNQQVNTVTDLSIGAVVVQGGFTGNPDRVPLAIIDTDGSGNIKVILDRRPLFFRLGTASDPHNGFTWASNEEPTYAVNLTGGSGTYVAGETVTFSGGATATVVTGGTTDIAIRLPSGVNFASGNTLVGGTSGASRTVNTVIESFTGADKDIDDLKEVLSAIQTEIRRLKGTSFWHQIQENSLTGLSKMFNSALVGLTAGARWAWSGSELSITDDSVSPNDIDAIARLRLLGKSQVLQLDRQDGTASTSTLAIGDGQVLFIKLPASGDMSYLGGVGTDEWSYQVVDSDDFEINDENYWLAVREGSKLYIRGYGELMSGESAEISDPISQQILTFLGAISEADSDPNYSSTTVVAQGSSLTTAIGALDANAATTTAALTAEIAKTNQDRGTKLIKGGTWNWVQSTGVLSWSSSAYLQIPGLADDVNEIAAGNATLDADGKVAYVTTKRTAGASTLVVSVADIASVPVNDNVRIIARRVGNDVLVGSNSFLLKDKEYLELDGALAEINRLLGQLRIIPHETDLNKVRISTADVTLLDGNTLSQAIGTFIMQFDGAVINFTTGEVFEADGSTPLGNSFTPFSVPSSEYFWYAISLLPGDITSDNRQKGLVQVDLASSSNAVIGTAPKSVFSGDIKLGQVQVRNNGGNVERVAITRLGVGSGSGSASSGGDGILSPIPGYQWLEKDDFSDLPTSTDNKVTRTNYTNATYDVVDKLYKMSCDKSRTVNTSSGTALTLNLAPGFTVAVGDIVYVTSGARLGQWRRIDAVGSQTSFTLDAAFTGGNASNGDTLMIAQAVWTMDLVNYGSASEKTRARDFLSGNITTIALEYMDSLTAGDEIADQADVARVVASASNDGLLATTGVPTSDKFSPIYTRPTGIGTISDYTLTTNTNQERLHLVFFPNPNNGSVTTTANILEYQTSFYAETFVENGGVLESAFCMSDGSGTELNCSAPTVVSSKTRVPLNWSYIPSANSGETAGQLEVRVDGLVIPRFVSGVTNDAYYKEVQNSTTGVYDTIELHTDLSLLSPPVSIEIVKREGVIDTSDSNSTRITTLFEIIVGTAAQVAAGTAHYSSLQSAINGASSGQKIVVLGQTISETLTINKRVFIEGRGYTSTITGNTTITSAAAQSIITGMRFDGNITFNSGADKCFMTHCFQAAGKTFTNDPANVDNVINVITE